MPGHWFWSKKWEGVSLWWDNMLFRRIRAVVKLSYRFILIRVLYSIIPFSRTLAF